MYLCDLLVVFNLIPFITLKLLWNFTNLCLVALNITHNSNNVIIDRLQRRVGCSLPFTTCFLKSDILRYQDLLVDMHFFFILPPSSMST